MVAGDIALVDGDAHDARVLERLGEARPARAQPIEQPRHRGDLRRQLDTLLGPADPDAQPGEIKEFHASDLWFSPARFNRSSPKTSTLAAVKSALSALRAEREIRYCARKPPSTARV